jgi:hypothetical protein
MNYTSSQHDNGNLHEIISRLSKVRRVGEGRYVACCAVHQDRTPSLAVTQKPDGVILLHCHGCGAGGVDICNALGIDPASLTALKRDSNSWVNYLNNAGKAKRVN